MAMDESFNEVPENNIPASEYIVVGENVDYAETTAQDEYTEYREFIDADEDPYNRSRINREKKNQAMTQLTGTMVATIAAVAVGVTNLINVNLNASFNDVQFADGVISYEIAVEDLEEDNKLNLYFYDGDKLVETYTLADEDADGVIAGEIALDTNEIETRLAAEGSVSIPYRLTLKGEVGLDVERAFDSYLVKIDKMVSQFDGLEGNCQCSVDGCYHFKMNFEDDGGLFNDFAAEIRDNYGNVAACTFTENLHEEQTIFVGNMRGTNAKLVLTYTADGQPMTVETDITI